MLGLACRVCGVARLAFIGDTDGGRRAVFVNHVSKAPGHFGVVAKACGLLRDAGFDAVPHVPACRFDADDDAAAVVAAYGDAPYLFALGGNDQGERRDVAKFKNAFEFLQAQVVSNGAVDRVCVAGHPEGHPGLQRSRSLTFAALEAKVALALGNGIDVDVVSQWRSGVLSYDGEARK